MFAAQIVGFGLLFLFLKLLLALLLFLCLSSFVGGGLLGSDVLVFDIGVVVGPPTCGTESVQIGLNVVITELTDLRVGVSMSMSKHGA